MEKEHFGEYCRKKKAGVEGMRKEKRKKVT